VCLYSEIKTIIQTNLRPASHKAQTVSEIQPAPPPIYQRQQKQPPGEEEKGRPEKIKPDPSTRQGVSPALMTTLLLVPLVLVVSIAVFIRWRKSRVYGGEITHAFQWLCSVVRMLVIIFVVLHVIHPDYCSSSDTFDMIQDVKPGGGILGKLKGMHLYICWDFKSCFSFTCMYV
jgi:hypothetical protein